jgi:hypothetical protein
MARAQAAVSPDTLQQMQRSDTHDVLGVIGLQQSPFNLRDLRSHRAAQRNATGIVDVQADHRTGLWDRASGGLQCIATHQSHRDSNRC